MLIVTRRALRPEDLKRGDRVVHVEHGAGTVTKVRKKDGAVFLRMDADGIEGSVCAAFLRRERPNGFDLDTFNEGLVP